MDESLPFLRNCYWILRHGKSIPNENGLIVSSMENGTLEEFGLAPEGVQQAKLAGELLDEELKARNVSIETVRICYSPFSRTTHTAKVVADVLGISLESFQCKAMTELRERFFGPLFELHSHDKYAEIWAIDEINSFTSVEGGESVADVASRLSIALTAMETEYQGCNILVVSHGDPLQIFQAILNAAKEISSSEADISSRIEQATTHSVLSQHKRCRITLVSHGDPLQAFQTTLNAAKENLSLEAGISSRMKQVVTHSFLSQHRRFALLTAELRQIK